MFSQYCHSSDTLQCTVLTEIIIFFVVFIFTKYIVHSLVSDLGRIQIALRSRDGHALFFMSRYRCYAFQKGCRDLHYCIELVLDFAITI